MKIITVLSIDLIPPTHEYQVFQGSEADCRREFAARYPHYDPSMAYYLAPKRQLWVPMNVVRVLAK